MRLLRNFKPDLCYITTTAKGPGMYKDFLIIYLVKLFKIKLVHHFHNKGVATRQHKWFDNMVYRNIFNNSEIILLSKYLYSDIQKYVAQKNVHYCPNGVPILSENKLYQKQKLKEIRILFLSNLIESKGVYLLLKACAILQKRGFRFKCTFVGKEGDIRVTDFEQKIIKLGLINCVEYAGAKYDFEKEKEFNKADIFVFPTYYHNECFPLVLLEAMQHKLPIISSYEGGIPDIVDDQNTGFLFKQRDLNSLVEKIEQLITLPTLRQEMGLAGYRKFLDEFTLISFESRLKEILNRIIDK
jgi:glycosyltransferase involved in cell wall biosynthesis